MTDRYERIRKALAMGPTPGPWEIMDSRTDTVENAQGYPVCTVHWHPDERYGHGTRAVYIAACDPDTIRALLDERDALKAENERLRNELMAAEDCSQMWHDLACRLQDDIDPPAHVGITTDGSLVLMRHEAQVSA